MAATESRYRTIFDLSNDALFLHDADTGEIVDVNRRATELYRCTRDEALHLNVADLSTNVAPYTQERAVDMLNRARAGVPQLFEWHARDRSGRTFWVEVNLKKLVVDGRDCLLACVREITDRKHAELELRKSHEYQKTINAILRLALENDGLDAALRQALAVALDRTSLAGYSAVVQLVDADGALRTAAQVGDAHSGSECRSVRIVAGESLLGTLTLFGRARAALDAADDEFLAAFTATLAGIIVHARTEEHLRTADGRLRDQAALVRLGELAAVVAHEVKNPLAGVRGGLQVIGGRLPQRSTDAAIVAQMIARLDDLDELMGDLLLFARPPQARLVPIDLAALAGEVSTFVAQDATAEGVRIEVRGEAAPALGDPKLLRSVFLNLTLNAVHAVQKRGTVCIAVEPANQCWRISIADTGPGISADIRDRIFVPFFTTKARGTGLGLPTAKRLVEAHNGRIAVDCPPAGGTIVTVELPRG